MKKAILLFTMLLLCLCCAACKHDKQETTVTTVPTVPSTMGQTTVPTTQVPLLQGWQTHDGVRYYYVDDKPLTGWQNIDGVDHYFLADGALANGWVDVDAQRYYFDTEGRPVTGWLELDGVLRYFKEDGAMARGCVEIDGVKHYFTSTGANILLVNPWNYVPEDYDPVLVSLDKFASYGNMYISEVCYEDLMAMLTACKSECSKAMVVSSYRTHEFQTRNYQRKVQQFLDRGYDQEEAERLAAQVVAVPGTSEHQLGLAVDIVDVNYPYLTESQANMPAQQWLMEHCWEYGFILRYPAQKTDVTGIIYEPWHYRYVGKELAQELTELGLTLEEYLDALTEADD